MPSRRSRAVSQPQRPAIKSSTRSCWRRKRRGTLRCRRLLAALPRRCLLLLQEAPLQLCRPHGAVRAQRLPVAEEVLLLRRPQMHALAARRAITPAQTPLRRRRRSVLAVKWYLTPPHRTAIACCTRRCRSRPPLLGRPSAPASRLHQSLSATQTRSLASASAISSTIATLGGEGCFVPCGGVFGQDDVLVSLYFISDSFVFYHFHLCVRVW